MWTKSFADDAIYWYGATRIFFPRVFTRPLGFFLYITSQCNLHCGYCWQREEKDRCAGWMDTGAAPLDPDQWARVVRFLPFGCYVGISGGEPTLSGALPAVIRAAGPSRPVTINTNGVAWKDEHLELFTSGAVKNVSVSLDGFADVTDAVRGEPGIFDRIVSNVSRLRALRGKRKSPSLTIKAVLLDENAGQLPAFHRFCEKDLKAGTLNVSFLKQGCHAQFSMFSTDDLKRIFKDCGARLHAYKNPEKVAASLGALLNQGQGSPCRVQVYPRMKTPNQASRFLRVAGLSGYRPCTLPWAQVAVLPDGEVIPCLSLALGNVKNHGYAVLDVLKKEGYARFCAMIRAAGDQLPEACHACCYLRFAGAP